MSDVRMNSNMHQQMQGICTLLSYFHHLFYFLPLMSQKLHYSFWVS